MNYVNEGHLDGRIERLRSGDASAVDELLSFASERLLRLTRKLLGAYPRVRRWQQTDDILQNSLVRLRRALRISTVSSARHFLNLAALQIRRELIDMGRKYKRLDQAHETDPSQKRLGRESDQRKSADSTLLDFFLLVERLPKEEQEICNFLFVDGMTPAEASLRLGVSESTLRRRWTEIRLSFMTS
jgi:RNA polymerase sigma factor (sigma-70 family)